jgi:hypothetical protein
MFSKNLQMTMRYIKTKIKANNYTQDINNNVD